ncbi:MAG: M28 family metallopeptidase [Chitinophagales bacterium]
MTKRYHLQSGKSGLSLFAFLLFLQISPLCSAQNIDAIINAKEVERIEKILSSDEMQGRKSFSPGLERAADFISGEFKAAGINPLMQGNSFLQTFNMVKANTLSSEGKVDGKDIDPKNIIVLTSQEELNVNNKAGYVKKLIRAGDNFRGEVSKYLQSDSDLLIVLDTSFSKNFPRLNGLKGQQFKSKHSTIFLLYAVDPKEFEFHVKTQITESTLSNVVGMIPGKGRKNEYVIFSAHYDHLGIGKPNAQGDSIYNGANDDASGTTAVIMLAKYFAQLRNNERTLIFAAFAAEEIGGFGSQYFSKQLDPAQTAAMINIEMIGTESKWGRNSAYMTGYERTDMGKIMQKNLEGSKFSFYADPYPEQHLFFRSDNATLARQGVPACSFSTSKMDSEKYYHTVDDEIETLDMNNMAEIIKAFAIGSASIISGKDSPSRVDTKDL